VRRTVVALAINNVSVDGGAAVLIAVLEAHVATLAGFIEIPAGR
jgi:hypothetical protein